METILKDTHTDTDVESITQETFALMVVDNLESQEGIKNNFKGNLKLLADKIAALFFKYKKKASNMFGNNEEIEAFLLRTEEKFKSVPKYGERLKYIPECILLLRSYYRGEYTDISRPELILIFAALIYFVSPLDIIPDFVPVLGFLDDIAVNVIVVGWCEKDINKYLEWLNNKNNSQK